MSREATEREWQQTVIEALRLFGWRLTHFRPAQTKIGWRTPLEGDAGFPDIVAVRDGWMLALELKSERGRATPEQQAWLADLAKVPGVVAAIVRPSQWRWLEVVLKRPDLADRER